MSYDPEIQKAIDRAKEEVAGRSSAELMEMIRELDSEWNLLGCRDDSPAGRDVCAEQENGIG